MGPIVSALALLAAAAAAPAAEAPAKREPGAAEPWQEGMPLMAGDRWARLRLDVDARGRPLKCRIAATNLSESCASTPAGPSFGTGAPSR